jgi:hypothetical protein
MGGVIDNAKGMVGTLRDGLIVLIVISLFLFPDHMNRALARAGFVKGSIAGFDWESTVRDNNAQLADAGKAINLLEQQLTTTQNAMKESEAEKIKLAEQMKQTVPGSPAAQTAKVAPAPQTSQIISQNDQALKTSAVGRANLQERIRANDSLLATVIHNGK